jgi:hypothetical protein
MGGQSPCTGYRHQRHSRKASHLVLQADSHELCHGDAEAHAPQSSYPLEDGRQEVGHLEVAWNHGRMVIDRDDAIALMPILPALAAALRRTSLEAAGGGRLIARR